MATPPIAIADQRWSSKAASLPLIIDSLAAFYTSALTSELRRLTGFSTDSFQCHAAQSSGGYVAAAIRSALLMIATGHWLLSLLRGVSAVLNAKPAGEIGSRGAGFFGNLDFVFHRGVSSQLIGTIPALLFSFFELLFQAVVCSIAVGGFVQRGRLVAVVPFIYLWSTLVYNPLCHAVWGGGWLASIGVLDFAGGTPVHIASGASATAVSVYLSWPVMRSRKSRQRTPAHIQLHRAQSNVHQMLSMGVIWQAWCAFDAGTPVFSSPVPAHNLIKAPSCPSTTSRSTLFLSLKSVPRVAPSHGPSSIISKPRPGAWTPTFSG
jgi:hypothetical protein